MALKNYESRYWGLIYDQMMEGPLAPWLAANRSFYAGRLAAGKGRVLECACGTGLILLPLLERGIDIVGFDASTAMLSALTAKSPAAAPRVSRQRLESFAYDTRFDAVIVPTNSFSMLLREADQLATLSAVRRHLNAGGLLMLDIRLADAAELTANADGIEGRWHEWHHPETGETIRQRIISLPHDFEHQRYRDRCEIEYRDDRESFPMESRWIFRDQFERLLRAAGFTDWDVEDDDWGSYWTVTRSSIHRNTSSG